MVVFFAALTCVSPPEEMTAIEGEQIVLTYKLPADKILDRLKTLTFYKNENIYDKPDNIVRHDDGVSFSLSMHNVTQDDEGDYFAYVNTFKSNITKLTVQCKFLFLLFCTNYRPKRLYCNI